MQSGCNHDDTGTAALKSAAKPGSMWNFSAAGGGQGAAGGLLRTMLWLTVKGDNAKIVEFGMGAAETAALSAMAIQAMVFGENVNFIVVDGKFAVRDFSVGVVSERSFILK